MKLNKLNEKTKLRLVIGFFILALVAIIFLIAKNGWMIGSADTSQVSLDIITKKINFIVSDDFSDQELNQETNYPSRTTLTNIINNYYPKIENIMGNPSKSMDVLIRKTVPSISNQVSDPSFVALFTYGLGMTPTIFINDRKISGANDEDFEKTMVHEMTHSWYFQTTELMGSMEESLAQFITNLVFSSHKEQIYDYDNYNKSYVKNLWRGKHPLMADYVFAPIVLNKIYIEDKNFIKKLNSKIMGAFPPANPGDVDRYILSSVEKKIENETISEWLPKQYFLYNYFFDNEDIGKKWITHSDGVIGIILIYEYKGQSWGLLPVKEQIIDVELRDLRDKSIGSKRCKSDNNGYMGLGSCLGDTKWEIPLNKTLKVIYSIPDSNVKEEALFIVKRVDDISHPGIARLLDLDYRPVFNKYLPSGKLLVKDTINNKIGEAVIKEGEITNIPEFYNDISAYSFFFLPEGETDINKAVYLRSYNKYLKGLDMPIIDVPESLLQQENVTEPDEGETPIESANSDPQRKQDLQTIKTAIDTYYSQKGEFPGTDGWISGKDVGPTTNESLAETLLPAKVIDTIPCDPAVSESACQAGGTEKNQGYIYYRDDYCGGDKDTYSLYATLDSPSAADKATLDGSAKCNSHSDITGNPQVNYRLGGSMVNDKQRKADLAKLKVAIDKYYEQKKELPGTDGWISSVDFLKQNDSLAETLLPAAVIDKIPVDPTATGPGGNGGYIYYRDDYCDGDKYTYSLYAQLDNPSAQDKETMKSGAKCNSHSDITGNPKVNYRLGATIPKPDYETTTISGKGAKIYPVSKLPDKYQEILKVKLIKGWNMVSIPFGIEKKEANKGDFDGLPQFNSYLPGQNKYQQETVNQPGSGYLVMSPAPKEYAITNVDKVKILDDDPLVGQFEIPLKKGWNLIGNPYLRETDTANWQVKYTDRLLLLFRRTKTVDFALAATYINPKLMIMNNQQYADATKLAPYQGAWIYSYKDGVTLLIP